MYKVAYPIPLSVWGELRYPFLAKNGLFQPFALCFSDYRFMKETVRIQPFSWQKNGDIFFIVINIMVQRIPFWFIHSTQCMEDGLQLRIQHT